jgi:glycosyltransferase involved in cell wall biosynthesis
LPVNKTFGVAVPQKERIGVRTAVLNTIAEVRSARCIIVQPVVPEYRIPFFDRLASDGVLVFASEASGDARTAPGLTASWFRPLGRIRRLPLGLEWQSGALSIDIRRGTVVVVPGAPRCLSNIVLLLKARLLGARTVWWGHYWSATSRPWRAAIRYLLMRLASTVVFYTDAEAQEYGRRAKESAKRRVFSLNNGIDATEIVKLRAPYDPEARGHRILFIGRLTAKSRLELLLKALSLPSCSYVSLEIIGSGEREVALRSLANHLGLGRRIVWHGRMTNERQISIVANACSLFVYPGAVGLSLVHALSYGLPVIVHSERRRHMPEIAAFEEGKNGFGFEPDNHESLATAIATALADADRLRLMSAAAVKTTAEDFNVDEMARRFRGAVAATMVEAEMGG